MNSWDILAGWGPLIFVHLFCGWLAWGIDFAYFQREYPTISKQEYKSDLLGAISVGVVGGFITLVVAFVLSEWGKHGIKWVKREPEPLGLQVLFDSMLPSKRQPTPKPNDYMVSKWVE